MAVTQVSRGVATGRAQADVDSGRNNADVSQREDLASFISMITRDETPFMASIGKTKISTIYHEWQTDTLEPPGDSRVREGYDYSDPVTPNAAEGTDAGAEVRVVGPHRTRLGNYAQINAKTIAVSGTRRAIDQAGVADEYAYQLKKRGTEMRRDVEHDLIHTFQTASGGTTRRTMGGYQSFINDSDTVVFANASSTDGFAEPANPGQGDETIRAIGTGTGQPTKQALSLSDIDQVMQNIYEEGGRANRIMVSPKLRRDFSDLLVTDSGVRRNIDEKGKLRQSVDVYQSDFGDLMIVPNYIMGLTSNVQFQNSAATPADLAATTDVANFSAFIYDPQWFSMATLRPMQEVQVGQKGDSTIGMFVEEQTFIVRNPVGCGAIYNLT